MQIKYQKLADQLLRQLLIQKLEKFKKTPDVSRLATNTTSNTKIVEVENNFWWFLILLLNILTGAIFDEKLKQVKLAINTDIVNIEQHALKNKR